MDQRIYTVEDTAEATNNELFDWKTNQNKEEQQGETEIRKFHNKYDKEYKAATATKK